MVPDDLGLESHSAIYLLYNLVQITKTISSAKSGLKEIMKVKYLTLFKCYSYNEYLLSSYYALG